MNGIESYQSSPRLLNMNDEIDAKVGGEQFQSTSGTR